MTLQGAKDSSADNFSINPATGRRYGDFLSYYLAKMNLAGQTAGMRLLDALDVHWYPEATGLNASGVAMRITAADASPGVVAARMSAPRSLWDSSYVETSWITKNSTRGKAIALLPRLNSEIADNYPGTKLSISEYNFGGGSDISGGVAEADVLGLFGKYNVFAAAEWPSSKNERFILGAMRMFRNFDGKAGAFGDTSVRAVNSNPADTSIYASIDSIRPGRLVMVAINRTSAPITATITLQNTGITYASFTAYQLTSGCAATSDGACELPTLMGTFSTAALNSYTLPGQSVSTLVLNRTP
jgi:hypothetical protein